MVPLNIIGDFLDTAHNVVEGTKQVFDFTSDPLGATAKAIQDANTGLTKVILPWLADAIQPDLSLSWFTQSYAVSFAVSLIVFAFVLLNQFYRTGRNQQGGTELAETLSHYVPMFVLGAAFGPALGSLVVDFLGGLTDAMISWGISGGTDEVVKLLGDLIKSQDPGKIIGGAIMSILFGLGMLGALMVIVVVLLFQLVTLYFLGVAFPIVWMFITDPARRESGFRIVRTWVMLLAAHPLVFFLIGVTFKMAAATIGGEGSDKALSNFIQSIVVIIAMFMCAFAPFKLLKFVPVQEAAGAASQPDVAGSAASYGAGSVQSYVTNNNQSSSSSSTSSTSVSGSSNPASAGTSWSPQTSSSSTPTASPFAEALSRGTTQHAGTSGSVVSGVSSRAATAGSAAEVGGGAALGGGSALAGGTAAAGGAEVAGAAGGPVGLAVVAGVSVAAKSVEAAKKTADIAADMADGDTQ